MPKIRKKAHTTKSPIERLLDVVHQLRRECPWDRKQTHRSLIRYLLEEAYETADAIESRNDKDFCEELGDLLLQVVLHSELARERKAFSFDQVAEGITQKMIRRHPHIFDKTSTADPKDHARTWTRIKSQEKKKRNLLEGIPKKMPALQLSQRYGEIAGSVGFDWPSVDGVLAKLEEEKEELMAEIHRRVKDKQAIEMELGDLLFTLANLARHLNVDAEAALRKSSLKFGARFTRLEKLKKKEKKQLTDCSSAELEKAWQEIKLMR